MIGAMARVTYESRDNAGHKFWVARYGRYAIRIDATRRGVYPWLIAWRAARSARGSLLIVTRPPQRWARPWTSCPASNPGRALSQSPLGILELGRPIAAPLERCAELLGVDLATICEAAANIESHLRADGTRIWSPMQLERQLRPEAYGRRRGGYLDRRRIPAADG
jgi:hypothetical protein